MTEPLSPSVTFTEGEESPELQIASTSTVLFVQAPKGPTDPISCYSYSDYVTYFGEITDDFRQYHAQARGLLAVEDSILVQRMLGIGAAFSDNHPSHPSPEQIVAVEFPSVSVVEGTYKNLSISVTYAAGNTEDLTYQDTTSFQILDPSFGKLSGSSFKAFDKLGATTLKATTKAGVFQATVTVVILAVEDITLYGGLIVTSGQATGYRSIARFTDGTSQDVTYLPQCTWTLVSGQTSEFRAGVITGETVSVDSQLVFSITYKNLTKQFTLTVKPTPITLISAGKTVFQLLTIPVQLAPVLSGSLYSHVCEWELSEGSGLEFNSTTILTPTVTFLAINSKFFKLTLFIDRNTINEQSASVEIHLMPFSYIYSSLQGSDISKALKSTGQEGLHVGKLAHYSGAYAQEGTPDGSSTQYVAFLVEGKIELIVASNVSYGKRISTFEVHTYTSTGWKEYQIFHDVDSFYVSNVPEGWYRIRMHVVDGTIDRGWHNYVMTPSFRLTVESLKTQMYSKITTVLKGSVPKPSDVTISTRIQKKVLLSTEDDLVTMQYNSSRNVQFDSPVSRLLTKVSMGDIDSVMLSSLRAHPKPDATWVRTTLLTTN